MEEDSWSWSDFDFERCWDEIYELWQSKALRDNLTKGKGVKDSQKGEEDSTIQSVRPPWRSASSIWVEKEN